MDFLEHASFPLMMLILMVGIPKMIYEAAKQPQDMCFITLDGRELKANEVDEEGFLPSPQTTIYNKEKQKIINKIIGDKNN